MKQVFFNLLANAIKYTRQPVVLVKDNGVGFNI
jgi:signal transduction histidine kinase